MSVHLRAFLRFFVLIKTVSLRSSGDLMIGLVCRLHLFVCWFVHSVVMPIYDSRKVKVQFS